MNGRFFAGQRIEASLFTGKQRFKRSGAVEDMEEGGTEESEKERLANFTEWLMEDGD
jgi:HIV Tat-specific factor 1